MRERLRAKDMKGGAHSDPRCRRMDRDQTKSIAGDERHQADR
jgi:hypothetical protein